VTFPAVNLPVSFTTRSQLWQAPNLVPFHTNSKPCIDSRPHRRMSCSAWTRAADEWLESARRRALDAPDAVRVLLTGRSRVDVGLAEAERAQAWAAQLPGWQQNGRPVLFVYTPGAMLVSG
jgi:hypothetical protein